ncbi:MAG TPA: RodZ domain-containing protein [Sphingomicrobium sp.]|nr:RodZ domain-containing protein [Sphingomicrobium sp.]
MDEETEPTEFISVGDRLRAAREERGLSLEDIAAETRIPHRHLESLESGDWERLPAPTYTIGFAKSYAGAVGLDRVEIGEQVRAEIGGTRSDSTTVEHFEPADPARSMPKWLVLAAIVAILVVVGLFSWIQNRGLEGTDAPVQTVAEEPPGGQQPTQAVGPQSAVPQGPVAITAAAPAWIRVTDQGETLYEGMLQPGQTYTVPPNATAPLLRAGAPEALRITVGDAQAPPVGPAGQVTSDVSLLPEELMRNESEGNASAVENSLAQ